MISQATNGDVTFRCDICEGAYYTLTVDNNTPKGAHWLPDEFLAQAISLLTTYTRWRHWRRSASVDFAPATFMDICPDCYQRFG